MTAPRPQAQTRPYWPALDGLRAVAVTLVVAYHLGYLPGGWLGVDVFFVLSGFLITSLLMGEARSRGKLRLGSFWARRARRLLPGVLLLLAVTGLYGWLGGPGVVAAQLRTPALAALFYGSNWQQIAAGHSYFSQFSSPNPLVHTWSLAIEEQYYLLWPLVLTLVLSLNRGRIASARRVLFAVAASGAVVSAAWMGLAVRLWGPDRAYLGTDTRVWELLVGVLGALWLAGARPVDGRALRRWRLAGPLGIVALGLAVSRAGGPPSWVWDGGLVGVTLGVLALLLAVVRHPAGVMARVLAASPLAWLGRLSYSLYLWHWPVIVALTQSDTGQSGWRLLGLRAATMVSASCASYYLVERPLRHADWSGGLRRCLAPGALAATGAVVLLGTATPAAAGVAVVAPARAAASSPPEPLALSLPAGRVPSPADPLRIWIVGDSVMNDSSPGLTAALEATGVAKVVANTSFGGWGLSTDRYWPGDGLSVIRQSHPEVVIGTWMWDDPAAQANPAGYRARLSSTVLTLLGAGVDDVVLLQFPATGPYPLFPTDSARQAAWISTLAGERAWDDAAERVAASFAGHAAYLRTGALFAPVGRFLAWMRTPAHAWLRARKLDDIHVCPYGAAEFGNLVLVGLAGPLDLGPARAGWETGPWTRDVRYNQPAGACPADQPPASYRGLALPPS